MNTNDRIKLLRIKHLKLTQSEFSKNISISRSNLGSIETGRVNVTDRVLNDISNAYNVKNSWLHTGEGEVFNKNEEDIINEIALQYNYSEDDKNHLREFASLNSEERKAVNAFVKFLKSDTKNDNKKPPVEEDE